MVNPEEVFWVTATFYESPDSEGVVHTHEDMIGVVYMSIRCWQDMPRELEIDGHTYKLEV